MKILYFSLRIVAALSLCTVCMSGLKAENHRLSDMQDSVKIMQEGNKVLVNATAYSWTWSDEDDKFSLYDSAKRLMVSGPLQPVVQVNTGRGSALQSSSGKVESVKIKGNRLTIVYAAVNGKASVAASWRFDAGGLWFEPVEYTGNKGEDVVSLYYFSTTAGNEPLPGLQFNWLIQPGLSAAGALSPVQILPSRVNLDAWIGRGATMDKTHLLQQWGLPVHFFCGMNTGIRASEPSGLTTGLPDAFCVGLADLPAGDMRLVAKQGRCAPVIDMRSDLWGQVRGIGPWKLGGTLYWSIARNYRAAISGYYKGLVKADIIQPKQNSAAKNEVMARPVFNTWGAQLSLNKHIALFDQAGLEKIYNDFRKSGLKASLFVIDDKWEGEYGSLVHASDRFPRFEEFLKRVRTDGLKIGMWAAFLRCENPQSVGLEIKNMLHDLDGKPITKGAKPFYLLDVSQPIVQQVLQQRLTQFMKTYNPELVKFDFGYELPPLSMSAPANRAWGGEKLLKESLKIAVATLRQVNPDVVVMYNHLSPLFLNELDLHSTDDLFFNEEEYAPEANRRLFFSSLMGELGIPSYGSGGYDWNNMDKVWFDNIASGPLGSLGSFSGDPLDSKLDNRMVAKFNGLAQLTRTSNVFSVDALHAPRFGANAARASSWIRYENGALVLAALRTEHITSGNIQAEFKDEIKSNVMVVMASRDEKSITSAGTLGIVPFGQGKVAIKHSGPQRGATVTAHYLGGGRHSENYKLIDGFLHIPLSEKGSGTKDVEWIEVVFH